MATLLLKVEPCIRFRVSVGTTSLIKLLRQHLNPGLAEAKEYVDRCVFGGEEVAIVVSEDTANLLLRELTDYPLPAKVTARIL